MSPTARRRSVSGVRGASARRSSGLASSRARFAARAAEVRRRPWRLAALLAGVLLLLAGGVWLVELSPFLVARSVRVQGVPAQSVPTVVGRADVPVGTPLARIDTLVIARRVIAMSALADVTVSRSWPSSVVISARLRTPVLAVKDPKGQVQVVDSLGVAYARVSGPPKGVPLISTVESPPSRESLRAAISVLRMLSSGQRGQVTDVTVLGQNLVTLKLGGVTIVWGGASQPELKVKVVTALLRQPGVATIDVSAPLTPVVR